MAQEPRFDVQDFERIFRALLPNNQVDPFGRIEDLLISQDEDFVKDGVLTDKFRKDLFEQLDSIESRTFGILFLQIFRTLRFFFGLLPQGRIILLLVAAVTVLTSVLEDGEISLGSIQEAVKNTGLAKFIDDIMDEITVFTTEIADNVQELSFAASDVFASIAIQLDSQLASFDNIITRLAEASDRSGESIEDDFEFLERNVSFALNDLVKTVERLRPPANAAANADTLLGPALRALDDEIRTIPTLALKLVRFT